MRETIGAIFYVMGAILTLALLVFSVGQFVDEFQIKFNSRIDLGDDATYKSGLETSNNMFKWFYTIPILFIFIYMIWLVKVSIEKARYTRQDGNNYYDKF